MSQAPPKPNSPPHRDDCDHVGKVGPLNMKIAQVAAPKNILAPGAPPVETVASVIQVMCYWCGAWWRVIPDQSQLQQTKD